MNSNTLQAMLAVNAIRITEIHADIEMYADHVRGWSQAGEKAFAIQASLDAKHARRKLVKAVALQQTMKTELLAIHRTARIVRKTALLATKAGFKFVPNVGLTSVEIENDLDDLIDLLVPKKPDSRVA